MSGSCEFSNPYNDYSTYDYDNHYDYDFADEDKEQCLQTCLQKSKVSPHAVGCYFQKSSGQCIFLKTGTIVGSSGSSDSDTCWKFHEGNTLCECRLLYRFFLFGKCKNDILIHVLYIEFQDPNPPLLQLKVQGQRLVSISFQHCNKT